MDFTKGFKVILDNTSKNPECPHGPSILFTRTLKDGEEKFYACSAYRDRKYCKFYHWADQEYTESKKKFWAKEISKNCPKIDHRKCFMKLSKIMQVHESQRAYCNKCSDLFLLDEDKFHKEHEVTKGISDYLMKHPSELLKPLECSKKEAQYLFTKEATNTIINLIKSLNIKHVLCVGTPRIHEQIISDYSPEIDSLLLDIDDRYHAFQGPLQFCWFNYFNNHFFNKNAKNQVFSNFLQQDFGENFLIITDPPFGARIEPLADTLNKIASFHKKINPNITKEIPVMWINPYFMEPKIKISCPNFKMSDYKIDYDNHPLFTKMPKGRKFGSPVRIFTNIPLSKLVLPSNEGYRYCDICEYWVSEENQHCPECNKCTSKDGRTYVHCIACQKCVKPTWKHCKKCDRCCLPDHKCQQVEEEKKEIRIKQKQNRKRKAEEDSDDGIIEGSANKKKSKSGASAEYKLYMEEVGYSIEALSHKDRRKLKKKKAAENDTKVSKANSLNKIKKSINPKNEIKLPKNEKIEKISPNPKKKKKAAENDTKVSKANSLNKIKKSINPKNEIKIPKNEKIEKISPNPKNEIKSTKNGKMSTKPKNKIKPKT